MNEDLEYLANNLTNEVENLVHFEAIDSTHAMARRIIVSMDDEGQQLCSTLILADRQEHGQGRGDRRWISPGKGLFLSWLKSGFDESSIPQLPLIGGAAAHSAVTGLGIEDVRIKWPNDILVQGKKIAGLVVFARHGETNWATLGLGINLASAPDLDGPQETPSTAVAEYVKNGEISAWRHELVCTFISEVASNLRKPGLALEKWQTHLIQQPGEHVNVRLASGEIVSGAIIGLTDEGFLRVRQPDGERTLSGGDIVEK